MTRVLVDRNAGFCSGVKAALQGAGEELERRRQDSPGALVSYGELVHNPEVTADLSQRGIGLRDELRDIGPADTVLLRTHGVSPAVEAYFREKGIAFRNLTCARVGRVHRLIGKKRREGYRILIVGDPEHPEVKAHLGYAGPSAVVLCRQEDAESVRLEGRTALLAQTSTSAELYAGIAQILKRRRPDLLVLNTLCPSVLSRQRWIEKHARRSGASLIIGGKNSSNVRKLYEIAALHGPAFWIAEPEELDEGLILSFPIIACTAGASTPDTTITAILRRLESAGARIEMR